MFAVGSQVARGAAQSGLVRIPKLAAWFLLPLLVVLLVVNDELRAAWERWAGGKLPENHRLWGTTVLTWARCGKVLQIAAGLLVVIDLLSPEKLRARGAAARGRLRTGRTEWRELRTARELVRLHSWLIHVVIKPTSRRDFHSYNVRRGDHFAGVLLRRFPESELCDFAARVRAGLPAKVGYRGENIARYVVECADRFLRDHVGAEEYALFSAKVGRIVKHRYRATLAFLALAALPLLPIAVADWRGEPLHGPVRAVLVVAAVTASVFGYGRGFGALSLVGLRSVPPMVVYGATAAILDKTRPGHVLRWLALALFVMGAHFDLLAS